MVDEFVTVEKMSLLRKGFEGEKVQQMQVDLPFLLRQGRHGLLKLLKWNKACCEDFES